MSTRLVILGLLRDQPLHGYEIKQIIEEHMGDWTSIAFGSIYFALGKLSEEGLIEMAVTEKKGNRPSRSVYQITESGRSEFLRLLKEVWRDRKSVV
jgi:DNA-binding PadR family transcriptional regulator